MKKKPNALPPDLNLDDWRNWKFDGVLESERMACCLWEYARESAFIRDTLKRLSLSWKTPSWVAEQEANTSEFWIRLRQNHGWVKPEEANQIDANLRTIGNCFCNGFFPTDVFLIDAGKSFPKPWQSLTKAQRKERVDFTTRKRTKRCGGGFGICRAFVNDYLRELERRANANPPGPPRLLTRWGTEVLLVEIEWERYSPDKIVQHFRQWVTGNRPKLFRNRKGRPPGAFDPFAALDGLAIMRLLRHCKPSEAGAKAPKLWERHRGKQLFRTRKRALETFRKLFPLLPTNEQPLSCLTKAGRSR